VGIIDNVNLEGTDGLGVVTNIAVGSALGRRLLFPADKIDVQPETVATQTRANIPTYPEYFATQTVTGEYVPLGAVPSVTWSTPKVTRSSYRTSYSVLDLLPARETAQSTSPQTAGSLNASSAPVSGGASMAVPTTEAATDEIANTAPPVNVTPLSPENAAPPVYESAANTPGKASADSQKNGDRWFLFTLFALGVLPPAGYLGLRRRRSKKSTL